MNDQWIALALVCAVMAAVFATVSRLRLGPETRRKAVHVSLGLICLGFPWLFSGIGPVLVLCAATLGGLLYLRTSSGAMSRVLHGVDRSSWGDLCFPVAVLVLFALMRDPVTDYVLPLLVLSLADAVGAIIGIRYGSTPYSTDEGNKSLEGSVAFFFTAFLATHVCLLLGTDTGRLESLLIAVVVGCLVMLVEGISWRGLDNLFTPLATLLLVRTYEEMEPAAMTYRLAMLAAILVFFWQLRRRSYANDCVLLASALVLYLIWALAGWTWALAPVGYAVHYAIVCPPSESDRHTRHALPDLVSVCGAGLFWICAGSLFGIHAFALAFVVAWACQSAILHTAYSTWKHPDSGRATVVIRSGCAGVLVTLPAALVLFGDGPLLPALAVLLACGWIAAAYLWQFEWRRHETLWAPGRRARQFACGFALSLSALALSGI